MRRFIFILALFPAYVVFYVLYYGRENMIVFFGPRDWRELRTQQLIDGMTTTINESYKGSK